MKYLKIIFASLLVCCCFCFTACGFSFTDEDYSSDESICGRDNYRSLLSVKNQNSASCTYTADEFNGWYTVWSKSYSSDTSVSVTVSLSISSGKAKVVYVDSGNTVVTLIECTENVKEGSKTQTLSFKSGKSRIKVVALGGNDLNVSLSVK